ncbi:DUF883 family protein [Ensifer soli]|uniref:DUF883 family protein n=1 Tax=Ciceribacter sp. sgz301302 TaxID=3342379 RepID=UPI0035B8A8D1
MATGLFSTSPKKRNGAFLHDSVEDQIAEIRHDIAALARLLSDRGNAAGKDVKAKAQQARAGAEAGIGDLLAHGEQLIDDLRDRYAGTERQVVATVRRHPIATIGAAAALGILVASLLRR